MNAPPPKTLYHYCGVDAFFGIVRSKEFWLSSADFTNDYSEHRWLIDRALERLDAINGGKTREADNLLLHSLRTRKIPLFIGCFSSTADLLSQWRAYCEDGKGFGVGFSYEALERQVDGLRRNPTPTWLCRMSYEKREQTDELDDRLKSYRAAMTPCCGDPGSNVDEAHIRIWVLAAQCKNRGFHEESEYRIILMPTPPPASDPGISVMRFRVTNRGIVPYYAIPFSPIAITEIWLGPRNYARKEKNRDALHAFLRATDYPVDNIAIMDSEATYGGSR